MMKSKKSFRQNASDPIIAEVDDLGLLEATNRQIRQTSQSVVTQVQKSHLKNGCNFWNKFFKIEMEFSFKVKKIIGALYTILTFYLLTILLHLNRKTSEYIYNTTVSNICFRFSSLLYILVNLTQRMEKKSFVFLPCVLKDFLKCQIFMRKMNAIYTQSKIHNTIFEYSNVFAYAKVFVEQGYKD